MTESHFQTNSENPILTRLTEEYNRHCSEINSLFAWLCKREGKYVNDDTAKSWLMLIQHNYSAASSLYFVLHGSLPADGSLPGVDYVPATPSYTGKTS